MDQYESDSDVVIIEGDDEIDETMPFYEHERIKFEMSKFSLDELKKLAIGPSIIIEKLNF